MAYQVINARVKQKIDTEANWIADEAALGVIFEGEQAFVKDAAGNPVNFKIGDGTRTFSELPYFIAYYSNVISHKILYYEDSVDLAIGSTFRDRSNLYDLIINNLSGTSIFLKIGTTPGGEEIATEFEVPAGMNHIGLKYDFTSTETVYLTGLNGFSYKLTIVYFQYDEAPVAPSGGGGSAALFRYPKGHKGMFEPIGGDAAAKLAHLNATWDFTTGLGKTGTAYENCSISGYNQTDDMAGYLPVGLSSGETVGDVRGSTTNTIILTKGNLPAYSVQIPRDNKGGSGGVKVLSSGIVPGQGYYDLAVGGSGDPVNIQPKSRIVLYFVAITD